MATETIEEKVPEALKEEDGVADSLKETGKKEAPLSDDKEEAKGQNMEEQGEVDDGESGEEKAAKESKSPVTPVGERPTRIKKKVERYILPTPSRSSGSKPVSIEQGRGTRLKEIPNVAYKLSKRKPDDNLFLLHTILYGKKGKAQTLKRNIGQFSGYVWSEQEEEKQRARAKEKLEKCIKEKLIDFCDVLDIPINKSNVKKEELAVRVLEFLVHPKATRDIVLADSEKETKKRKKSTPKNVTSGESSDVPAKRRRQTKKAGKKQPSETEEGNDEGDVGSEGTNESRGGDDGAPEKENDKNEDTETEDEKDKAEEKKSTDKKSSSKRTKKEKPAPEEEKPAPEEEKSLKSSAKSGRKSSKQVDKSTSSSSKKQKVDKDDSSKEKGKKQTSKPQAKGSKDQGKASKKAKREPTSNEMHVVVAKILKEVDFNTATLSDILRMLGSHFGVDLMHRKIEVKDIITDAISEMSVDDEREEDTEDEGEENTEDEGDKMKEDEVRKGYFCFSSHFRKSDTKSKSKENGEKTV